MCCLWNGRGGCRYATHPTLPASATLLSALSATSAASPSTLRACSLATTWAAYAIT